MMTSSYSIENILGTSSTLKSGTSENSDFSTINEDNSKLSNLEWQKEKSKY